MTLRARAERIRAVILDVDGVLTDARAGYGGTDDEIKFFNVRDGLGIKLLQAAHIRVGLLSGRRSRANQRRAQELGLDFVMEGVQDKAAGFSQLLDDLALSAEECCYVGDDLVDIPVMRHAGLALAVADAAPETRAASHRVTRLGGGQGAVREVAEWLLKQQGRWLEVTRRYVQ